jgi:hypothetical protein
LDQHDHIQNIEAELAAFGNPHKWSRDDQELKHFPENHREPLIAHEPILKMFAKGNNLSEISQNSGLSPDEVFEIVRGRFVPNFTGAASEIELPFSSRIDREELIRIVSRSSFYFRWRSLIACIPAKLPLS